MTAAWAARRTALALPEADRVEAMASVRRELRDVAESVRDSGDPVLYAHALHLRAHVELGAGRETEAEALWNEAVTILRGAADPLQLAHKVRHLGDLEVHRGRVAAAASHYDEALALYRAHPDANPGDHANAVNRAAIVAERQGRTEAARALWLEAKARYGDLGIEAGVREAVEHLDVLGDD